MRVGFYLSIINIDTEKEKSVKMKHKSWQKARRDDETLTRYKPESLSLSINGKKRDVLYVGRLSRSKDQIN